MSIKGLYQLEINLRNQTHPEHLESIIKWAKKRTEHLYRIVPYFNLRIEEQDKKASIEVLADGDSLGFLHLKMGSKGLYIPKERTSQPGLTFYMLYKNFRPGVFNVSDTCVDKTIAFLNTLGPFGKKGLNRYRFFPSIEEGQFIIRITRDDKYIETFRTNV